MMALLTTIPASSITPIASEPASPSEVAHDATRGWPWFPEGAAASSSSRWCRRRPRRTSCSRPPSPSGPLRSPGGPRGRGVGRAQDSRVRAPHHALSLSPAGFRGRWTLPSVGRPRDAACFPGSANRWAVGRAGASPRSVGLVRRRGAFFARWRPGASASGPARLPLKRWLSAPDEPELRYSANSSRTLRRRLTSLIVSRPTS